MAGSWGQGEDWSHILQGKLGKLDIQDQLQAIRQVWLSCEWWSSWGRGADCME